MSGHEVDDEHEDHRIDDLKGHVGHHLGQVVRLHAVPVVQVLPLEGGHLHGERHDCRHHGREHGEEHAEEEHGRVVVHLGGLVADLPVEKSEEKSDCDVRKDSELGQGPVADDGEERPPEEDAKLGPEIEIEIVEF